MTQWLIILLLLSFNTALCDWGFEAMWQCVAVFPTWCGCEGLRESSATAYRQKELSSDGVLSEDTANYHGSVVADRYDSSYGRRAPARAAEPTGVWQHTVVGIVVQTRSPGNVSLALTSAHSTFERIRNRRPVWADELWKGTPPPLRSRAWQMGPRLNFSLAPWPGTFEQWPWTWVKHCRRARSAEKRMELSWQSNLIRARCF